MLYKIHVVYHNFRFSWLCLLLMFSKFPVWGWSQTCYKIYSMAHLCNGSQKLVLISHRFAKIYVHVFIFEWLVVLVSYHRPPSNKHSLLRRRFPTQSSKSSWEVLPWKLWNCYSVKSSYSICCKLLWRAHCFRSFSTHDLEIYANVECTRNCSKQVSTST